MQLVIIPAVGPGLRALVLRPVSFSGEFISGFSFFFWELMFFFPSLPGVFALVIYQFGALVLVRGYKELQLFPQLVDNKERVILISELRY